MGDLYANAKTYNQSGALCAIGYSCKSWKGKITINHADFKNLTTVRKKETMTHEMGHILGLAHEDYVKPSIMLSGPDFLDNPDPQTDDYNGIRAIYEY